MSRPSVIEVDISPNREKGSRGSSRDSGRKNHERSPLHIIMPPMCWDHPVRRWRVVFYFDILKDFNADCLNEIHYSHGKKKPVKEL
jgi:hypothetical protein